MTTENNVRSILSELGKADINVELDTSFFDPQIPNNTITFLLKKINCAKVTQKGVRGVANKFIRTGKPLESDQSICKDCSRLKSGCPIYENAIDPRNTGN